jgi:hypothetical protein
MWILEISFEDFRDRWKVQGKHQRWFSWDKSFCKTVVRGIETFINSILSSGALRFYLYFRRRYPETYHHLYPIYRWLTLVVVSRGTKGALKYCDCAFLTISIILKSLGAGWKVAGKHRRVFPCIIQKLAHIFLFFCSKKGVKIYMSNY